MKRLFVLFALVVVVVAGSGIEPGDIVSGQGIDLESADPVVSETELPTLPITVTDGGFWTRPEVPAGRYRVLVDNLTDRDVDLDFITLPEEWTPLRVQTAVRWNADATASAGLGPGVVPTQEYVPLQFAGSAAAKRHSTGHAVIELAPGQWIVTSLGAGPGSAYAAMRVTPALELESVLAAPVALPVVIPNDTPLLPWSLPADEVTLHVRNAAEVPSGLRLVRIAAPGLQDPMFLADEVLLAADAVQTGLLSPGRMSWITVTLEPGVYAAVPYRLDETGTIWFTTAHAQTFRVDG